MNLKKVLSDFSLEKNEQRRNLNNSNQLTALENPPKEFKNVAKAILSGHFRVQNSSNESERVEVYPTCVEIYYHEEQANGVKDPIVYHRNRKKKKKSDDDNPIVFPLGVLHNHVSGIDITFEKDANADNEIITGIVRASALIREFKVKDKDGKWVEFTKIKNNKKEKSDIENRSTYIYEYLFGQFSIFDGGFTISWKDGEECNLAESTYRKNVVVYKSDEDGADYEKSKPYRQDLRRWQFRKKL